MAAGDMVQKGTAVIVGFGGYTLTGYVMNDVGVQATAEKKPLKSEGNNTMTKLISDPGIKVDIQCHVTSGSSYLTMKIGDTISINSINMMVDDVGFKKSREETIVNITAVKEDSMTYT